MPMRTGNGETPAKRLELFAHEAIAVAKKAKKHNQNLSGMGFYASKLANLRVAATNAFTELKSGSVGDTSALAELVSAVFSSKTHVKARADAERELMHSLRTTWREQGKVAIVNVDDGLFPTILLSQTKRGYLSMIGRQMNGCFHSGFYDACAVMMRRLFEISIIEAFEHKNVGDKIKNGNGDYLHLSDLVAKALSEPALNLSRNSKKALPKLRDNGHLSAHGRSYFAQKSDLERIQPDFRVAVEEFLHIAGLL